MTDLKPCPFCGKPGTIWESRKLVPGYHDACRTVGCKACAYTLASKSETTTWLETGGCTTNTEEVDALLASVWSNRVSPWRSLKDDPPTKAPVLIRRGQSASWRFGAQIAPWLPVSGYFLERGYTEWMEVPE